MSERKPSPCAKCPWIQAGQPDLNDELRKAAAVGAWFCCHVNMDTCYGAQRFGNKMRRSKPDAPSAEQAQQALD